MTPAYYRLPPETLLLAFDYHISGILSCYPILYTTTCISSTFVLL